jgi:hypothetical protein
MRIFLLLIFMTCGYFAGSLQSGSIFGMPPAPSDFFEQEFAEKTSARLAYERSQEDFISRLEQENLAMIEAWRGNEELKSAATDLILAINSVKFFYNLKSLKLIISSEINKILTSKRNPDEIFEFFFVRSSSLIYGTSFMGLSIIYHGSDDGPIGKNILNLSQIFIKLNKFTVRYIEKKYLELQTKTTYKLTTYECYMGFIDASKKYNLK